MKRSLLTTNASISSKHDSAYVKSDDVDARIVFDVTVVSDRLRLNVNCAANHNGATCSQYWKEVYLPLALAGCPSMGALARGLIRWHICRLLASGNAARLQVRFTVWFLLKCV